MKFLRVEWTRKRGVIALLATGLVVTSFILGGYVATGNWNPWGNRHYYQVLNANFQECYTPLGGSPECQSVHNVMFNTGAIYVEKLVTSNNEGFCTVAAACSFHFIAMSSTTTAPTAGMSSTGTTTATTSGDCGVAGGTGGGGQNGAELTTNGFAAAAGTVTDITCYNTRIHRQRTSLKEGRFVAINLFSLEGSLSAKSFTDRNADSCSRCSCEYARWSRDEQRSHFLPWKLDGRGM